MRMMTSGKIILVIALVAISTFCSLGQTISGKIVFERKTNLEKKFGDFDQEWMADFLAENKYKTDVFELYFTDTCSVFRIQESDDQEDFGWTTEKNEVFENLNSHQKITLAALGGQQVVLRGVTSGRDWKITDSKRMIGKYECRKAFCILDDSTKIYAWYSIDILPSIGPEGFSGLPGTILGLAREDGGVVYFAKSVELVPVKESQFDLKLKKKKEYTYEQLKRELEDSFGEDKFAKQRVREILQWL